MSLAVRPLRRASTCLIPKEVSRHRRRRPAEVRRVPLVAAPRKAPLQFRPYSGPCPSPDAACLLVVGHGPDGVVPGFTGPRVCTPGPWQPDQAVTDLEVWFPEPAEPDARLGWPQRRQNQPSWAHLSRLARNSLSRRFGEPRGCGSGGAWQRLGENPGSPF